MGRPSSLTPEVQAKVVEALLNGNFREVAAGVAGIGESTLRKWMKWGKEQPGSTYEAFRAAVLKAERDAEAEVVARIKASADKRDQTWWLERKFPARWGRDNYRIREVEKQLAELRASLLPPSPPGDGPA